MTRFSLIWLVLLFSSLSLDSSPPPLSTCLAKKKSSSKSKQAKQSPPK